MPTKLIEENIDMIGVIRETMILETEINRITDQIVQVFSDHNLKTDSDIARNILLMLTISAFKIKAISSDLSNEDLAEILTKELHISLQAHFARNTTREIWKAVFTGIARLDLMLDKDEGLQEP
jgi:hypothetical protein